MYPVGSRKTPPGPGDGAKEGTGAGTFPDRAVYWIGPGCIAWQWKIPPFMMFPLTPPFTWDFPARHV